MFSKCEVLDAEKLHFDLFDHSIGLKRLGASDPSIGI